MVIKRSEKALPILHAGSLRATFTGVNAGFKTLHPEVEIISEATGSVDAVHRVTEHKDECGVLASADYKLISEMMFPDFADWYILFASDEMVLCYSKKSKYNNEINAGNWYEVLQREGVTYGLHDPNQDPGGYRTLMLLQLAEEYYGVPQLYQKLISSPGYKILPGNLIALIGSGKLDYAFSYKASATQNNARYITLPDNVNLASRQLEEFYAKAQVQITGRKQGEKVTIRGEPILFALTVPKTFSNQELAISWVDYLLGDKGMAVMKSMGMNPFSPAIASDVKKLPEVLKTKIK